MDIIIKNIIDSDFAVTTDDGNNIFEIILMHFTKNESVTLDFKGINLITTAFLNAAIGQLYSNKKLSSDFLNENISISNVSPYDIELFKLVTTRAKQYFANKEAFNKNTDNSIYGND